MPAKKQAKYKVKKTLKGWVVVDETGRIANDHTHKTLEEAETHCRNLNAFCGFPTSGRILD